MTERSGKLWHVESTGRRHQILGLPSILTSGQGGLLDVVVARDFGRSRLIYLTYVKPVAGGAGTALARARLSLSAQRLNDLQVLYEMPQGNRNGRHFGSRVVEAANGQLFLTLGDMGDRRKAQDLSSPYGKVLRLNRDGSIPRGNPFVLHRNALRAIWSIGHRNPQGAALAPNGDLWLSEHGAKGGDEINHIRSGANYGWPVIAYGTHYDGSKIGEGRTKRGMEQPKLYWDPSIAPSGLVVYDGKMFPEWRGDLFVGSLKFDHIAQISGRTYRVKHRFELPEAGRIRDVRQAPDGALWFLSENAGAVFRMSRQVEPEG